MHTSHQSEILYSLIFLYSQVMVGEIERQGGVIQELGRRGSIERPAKAQEYTEGKLIYRLLF